MRCVILRVIRAEVKVDDRTVGSINKGLVVLVGFKKGDSPGTVEKLSDKLMSLRLFADGNLRLRLPLQEVGGSLLVIPQFTLYAELKGQNRPFFGDAAEPATAQSLFAYMLAHLKKSTTTIASGEFGAHMVVESVNDGPVTIILDDELI